MTGGTSPTTGTTAAGGLSSLVGPTPYSVEANVYNLNPSVNLTKWRKGLANVRAGLANARILCIGDSTTFGVGSNGSLTVGNMMPLCFPQLLANALNAQGINAHGNSWSGMGASSTPAPNRNFNDSRLVVGSDFTFFNGSIPTIGGCYTTATADTTNPLTFTPTQNTDTCLVFSTNTGVSKMNANGGSNTVLSGTASTFSTTLGANTYKLSWSSGGAIFNIGMEAYDSSKKWVSVMNAGWQGSNTGNWNVAGIQTGINTVTPNLTMINLGINEWTGGAVTSGYTTNLQQIITYALAQGDCILVTPVPSQTSSATTAIQQGYISALYALAATNNIPLIDFWGRYGSYTLANSLGFMFNALHPIGLGYQDNAQQIVNVLASP